MIGNMKKSSKSAPEDKLDVPKKPTEETKALKPAKATKPFKKTNQAHRDDAFSRLAEVAKNAKNSPDDISQGSFAEHAQVTGFGSEGNIASIGDAGFKLNTEYKPAGDQPKAIKSLVDGVKKGLRHQTLLGVTGSGKTYTAANVISQIQKPTLVIAHNKTLAAQLAQEYKEFFPENAVHYFVSYYDYYQPEAYIAHSDTYIEKEAQINEEIDRLRHASTQALLTRKDVIIVASVSCIYGLGSPEEYEKVNLKIEKGMKADRSEFIRRLIALQFMRTSADLSPGTFRAVGNTMEIMPVNERVVYRLAFGLGQAPGFSVIEEILQIDAITRAIQGEVQAFFVFPAKHFVTPEDERQRAIDDIKAELDVQVKKLLDAGKIIEAERIKRRTTYDLALIREVGYCNGIENYSRHFAGKAPGEAPDTLLSYFPHKTIQVKNPKTGKLESRKVPDFLTIVDESHVAIPQIGGMFAGDASRKKNLIDFGFRLPSAADNRPLKFAEFEERVGQLIYTSATPGAYEYEHSQNIAEQIIRPTGLIDPVLIVKPITALTTAHLGGDEKINKITGKKESAKVKNAEYVGQIFDFIQEAEAVIKRGQRAIATTLTKKMAEDLTEFLKERGIKTNYVHSDIETLDRIQILTEFRKGTFDVLVGVNLLREGLDLPEVSLIGILDADKEGFLRSETALIQTIGRAARNVDGRVILYADQMTGSMERAIKETNRRRDIQLAYNAEHGITPKTIAKKIQDITEQILSEHQKTVNNLLVLDAGEFNKDPKKFIRAKEVQMDEAVAQLDFETAAILRDEIKAMKARLEGDAKRAEKKRKDEVKGIRGKRQELR
jgi:excinuclease ABC subunit B